MGIRRAFRKRKKYKIPAWAITSTVPKASKSLLSEAVGRLAGRSNVGPKTVAKLCSDILF